MAFTHLHTHTQFSLLDGFCRLDPLMERVAELGMKHIALTDHGNMFGAIQFYKAAKKYGLKPILGCEVYVCADRFDRSDRHRNHLVLLAENEQGYRNLMKIVSEAYVHGFYYKPRIDKLFLSEHHEGLIALSACLAGEVARAAVELDYESTKQLALAYQELFGRGNFFLEVQNHGLPEERQVRRVFARISAETGIGLVATNDVHYIDRTDAEAHDILLCIQTGKTLLETNRMKFPSDDYYLKSPEEMAELFSDLPQAVENTERIAARCQLDIEFHKLHLPHFAVPEGENNQSYLQGLVSRGIEARYASSDAAALETARARAAYELSVIEKMGYTDYFLIVHDFVDYAKTHDVTVGPGRGSAAGSIVAYALGITGIDPLEYDLLFERFLNPERVSMPDIDIDFCYERRDRVIEYVKRKYGEEKVAQIVTFGTMAAKNAIRDVARTMDIPLDRVDRIAKAVPARLNITLKAALQESADFRKLYEESAQNKRLIDMAMAVEGLPRHTSTHAAGVLIAGEAVDHLVPLSRNGDQITTQYNMTELEELGLLKMDFLGLRNLTVIRDAVELVEQQHGVTLDMDHIDVEDAGAMSLFHRADTIGIFQFESYGMRSFLRELKPDRFADLVAANALFRPGPMDQIPTYVDVRHHPEKARYLHPMLEPILKTTYGVIVYQEQVMQIVQQLAGYSLGGADNLRRAMSKKKMAVMEENRHYFVHGKTEEDGTVSIPGCCARGVPESVANQIFDQMIEFAKYAFNKSHSVAYAFVAMQTAILKKYYPCAFFAALLSSLMANVESMALYMQEAMRLGIRILPPDVNASGRKFGVENGAIRFALTAIKNVGTNLVDATVAARARHGRFLDMEDYFQRILEEDPSCLNRKAIEHLIKGGAMDCFGLSRAQMMMDLEMSISSIQKARRSNVKGQTSLFDQLKTDEPKKEQRLREYRKEQLLAYEKEVLGIYLSDHPFRPYEASARRFANFSMQELLSEDHPERFDGRRVCMGGLIRGRRNMQTKKNLPMCVVQLEDLYGVIEAIVFPKNYARVQTMLQVDHAVLVTGTLQISDGRDAKILADEVKSIAEQPQQTLYLRLSSQDRDQYRQMKELLGQDGGQMPVVLYFADRKQSAAMDARFSVSGSERLLLALKNLLGEQNVVVR
ncbi:MAG: DNA polymerase III subunit alpha [Ndongobacter sp.]|nr:DNA polymerase III subunit alpha [Ndongobacter sp.]